MKRLFIMILFFLSIFMQQLFGLQLSFKNPQLESGKERKVGAVYRFKNIAGGIDALVEIKAFHNGASLAEIDNTKYGLADAFQPTLKTANNRDSSVDFQITFVKHNTSIPQKITFKATGADIDGNGAYVKEYISLSTPVGYTLEKNTRLIVSESGFGLYAIPKISANVQGITVTETRNIVTASYTNTDTIFYRIGAKNGWGAKRLDSLYFKDVRYNEPIKEVALHIDVVEDFDTKGYHPHTKIKPNRNGKIVLDAVLLDEDNKTIKYHPKQQNNPIPMTVLFYTKTENDAAPKLIKIKENNSSSPVVAKFQGGKKHAKTEKFDASVVPSGQSEVWVKYLDYYDSTKVNLQGCSGSSQSGNLKGLPQCVNAGVQYGRMFGNDVKNKCFSQRPSNKPCSPSSHGVGAPPYDHKYGCYECTIDAILGTDPLSTSAMIENSTHIISITDVNQLEGDNNISTMTFTISFDRPVPASTMQEEVGFWITATDGVNAVSPVGTAGVVEDGHKDSERDFEFKAFYAKFVDDPKSQKPKTDIVYFKAGKTQYDINVSILGDLFEEPDEEFYIDIYDLHNIGVGTEVRTVDNGQTVRAVGTILNNDLTAVAEYRMDACFWNGTQDEVIDSVSGHHATAKNGATTAADGKIKRTGKFDKASYIDAGDQFDTIFGNTNHQFTITAWINPASLHNAKTVHNTQNPIIAKAHNAYNDNLEIGINENGSLHVYLDTIGRGKKSANFGSGIDTSKWHFVAVSYDGSQVKVMIDGKIEKNNTLWNNGRNLKPATGSPFTIGRSLHGRDKYFSGKIDEVKIYDQVLTDKKLLGLYLAEKNDNGYNRTSEACLIHEYRFDACEWFEPAGRVKDSVGGHNGAVKKVYPTSDAVLENAVQFDDTEALIESDIDYAFGEHPFSLSFWMKLDKMPTRTYMAIMNKDFEFYVGKNGKIYLNPKNDDNDLISSDTITKETWYYITITSDGNDLILYVDGNEKGRISADDLGKNGNSALMIGQTPWSESEDPLVEPFVGQIDEMKIFDQAISSDRIKQLIALDNAGKNINGSSREKLVCLDPVGCTSKAIVIDDTKYVHQIDLVTGEKNTTVMSTEQVNHASVNGFGYNVKDGFFWGSNQGKDGYLVKIGKDEKGEFAQKKVGPVEGLPTNRGTYIGDIDHNGMLYLYYKNSPRSGIHTMYIVDLNKESANYLKVTDSFTLSNIAVADMAFNPIDKQLYAIENDRDLYKIDVRNHTVRLIEPKAVGGSNDTFGTSFFDAQGFFYAIKNTSREVYRIDISDPSKIRSLVFSTLVNEDVQNVNIDGGRCNLKPIYIDYGDAPDSSSYSEGDGTGVMNYKTLTSDDGPRHRLPADENETNVYLGTSVSSESDAKSSATDYNYDNDDGIVNGIKPLYTNMYTYTLQLRVTNDRNITANLVGWIDFNRNGRFETKEGVSQVVTPNSQNIYTLRWSVPDDIAVGQTYARFRVTTDPLTIEESDSFGPKSDGEVEDWEVTIKEGSLYDVWDTASDEVHRVIKTKQANQSFSLIIASLNRAGGYKKSTGSHIKVRIVSKKDGTVLRDYGDDINLSKVYSKTIDFDGISQVTREAQVQIRFVDERNITREVNATDLFAIRPDHFEIVPPDDALIAGKDFNITLLAKDANDTVVGTFTESAENYLLDINETKTIAACRDLNVTVSKKETRDFENGESKTTIRYPDVGSLRFKLYEKPGSEYAVVDSADTNDLQRLIAADEKTYSIAPQTIALEWQLENGDSVNGVTYFNSYYADDADFNTMYAKLGFKITVKNAKNEPVKKFTDGCYARDIDISLKYQMDSNDTTDDFLVMASYEDRNGTFNTALSQLPDFMSKGEHTINDFKLEKSLFQEGIGIKTVKFNFNRNASLPLNPLLLKIEDINATLDTLSDSDNTSKSLKFFYVRAHIPDQDVVGKEMDAKVFYEVYCKECDMSKFGIANLPESVDSIHWYQLSSVNESEYFDFENPAMTNGFGSFPSGSISAITNIFSNLEKRNSGRILHVEVNKSPQTVRVKYEPKKYLVFNPFNSSATLHGFTASFLPKEKSWAGKGDTGYTVDTAIAPRNNLDIIDW